MDSLERMLALLWAVGRATVRFLRFSIRLLSTGTSSDSAKRRQLSDSDSLGIWNFRTRELDSGHDPLGWYEKD